MRRLHLIEIAEQRWCPRAVRDGVTDYLQFVIDRTGPYAAAAPILAAALRGGAPTVPHAPRTPGVRAVVDLGSGAGGPWRALAPALAALGTPVRVRLTDRYPNLAAYEALARATGGAVTGEPAPVCAEAVPPALEGARTAFSAFHHFAPPAARRVLRAAAARGATVAVFEATRRDPRALLLTCLTPLLVLLGTPLVRPFRWSRLLWTYLLPAIPLVVLVDGLVSCLRTYTPGELRALGEAADPGYAWDAGEVAAGPIPMTYLVGRPRDAAAAPPAA